MKLVFLKTAQIELDEAADYYAEHASIRVAEAFLLGVEHAHKRLVERPEIGPSLSRRLRILHLRHFPYSIIYQLSTDTIIIHAIAHQRR